MKKFRFRLEQVLKFRGAIRDEKLRTLLQCRAREQEVQTQLEFLGSERSKHLLPDDSVQGVERYMLAQMYVQRLDAEIAKNEATLLKLNEETTQALAAYIEASKDVKSLETLKDRKQREYMERVNAEEAKFLDEIATQKGNTLRAD